MTDAYCHYFSPDQMGMLQITTKLRKAGVKQICMRQYSQARGPAQVCPRPSLPIIAGPDEENAGVVQLKTE
jgi:hypothetical protein